MVYVSSRSLMYPKAPSCLRQFTDPIEIKHISNLNSALKPVLAIISFKKCKKIVVYFERGGGEGTQKLFLFLATPTVRST